MVAITDFVEAPGGVVSYDALASKITATALNSMIEYDLVHYRLYTRLDRTWLTSTTDSGMLSCQRQNYSIEQCSK